MIQTRKEKSYFTRLKSKTTNTNERWIPPPASTIIINVDVNTLIKAWVAIVEFVENSHEFWCIGSSTLHGQVFAVIIAMKLTERVDRICLTNTFKWHCHFAVGAFVIKLLHYLCFLNLNISL